MALTSDVQIGISMDSTGVETGAQKVKRSLAGLGEAAKRAGQDGADGLVKLGDGSEKSAKQIERDTRNMQGQLQRYLATLEAGSKESRQYWEKMADFRGIDKNALRPLLDQLDQYKLKAKEAGDAGAGFGASINAIGITASAVLGGVVVQSAIKAMASLYDASAAAERLRTGLDFASLRGSANEIAYLRKTTYDLGLSFGSTATAYMQFQAAAKGTAIEGDKARAVFESVAKASAVMGLSADNTSGVLLALQQMVSKGTVQSEELRGQLGERLPGAFQIAARSMGVTTAELGKMLEMGEVVASDFLPKFAAELEKSLGDSAEKAAGRLDASVNRVNDSWERMKQNVGDSGVSKFWAGQLNILTDGMSNFNESIENARAGGAGFAGQMTAAAGAALQFLNPLNAVSYTALEAGNKLKDAEARLKELKDAGAQSSSNLMLREAYAHAQRLVDKLREAKSAQDALVAKSTPYTEGMGNSNIITQQRNAEADSEKALMETRMRSAGINKQYFADLKTYQNALSVGTLDMKGYIAAVSELATKTYESSEAGKEAAKQHKAGATAAKAEQSTYASLMASIQAKIDANKEEFASAGKLTESDKLRIKLMASLEEGHKKLSSAHKQRALAALQELAAQEKIQQAARLNVAVYQEQIEAEQQLAADEVKRSKALEAARQAMDAYETSARDDFERLKLEGTLIGVSNQARAVALAQYDAELELKRKILEIDRMDTEESQKDELRVRARAVAVQKVAIAERKAYVDEWEKTSQLIGNTLADYIMGGGKDAAQYLKRLFATLVLEPVVRTGVSSILGGAQASGSASNPLGLLQSGQSLWSAFSGGTSGTLAAGVSGLGRLMGSSFLGELGSGIAAGGQLGIGGTASLIGSAGGTTGIGMALGAAAPWIAGAAALFSIIDSFDNSGTPHMGAQAIYQGGVVSRGSMPGEQWQDSTYTAVSGIAMALGQALDGTARAFGKTAGYSLSTTFADDSSSDGAFGALNITGPDGKSLVDWSSFDKEWGGRWFSDGEAGYKEYLATMATDVKSALQAMDLPAWSNQILASANDLEALNTALQQISTVKAVFDSLGHSMTMFADLSGSVQTTLLNVSGGIDALSSNAQSFYANYFSEQERLDATVTSLTATFAKYGATLPATAEQYRALVEQQMAAGDAGAEFAAVLLGLNGTFKGVSDAWKTELDGMTKTVGDFFTGIKDNIASVMAEVAGSRKDILRGTGTMTAAEIQAAIGNALVYSPSMANVEGAQGAVAAASSAVAAAKAKANATAAQSAGRQGAVSAVQSVIDQMQKRRDYFVAYADQKTSEIASYWDGGSNSGYNYGKRKAWSDEAEASRRTVYGIITQINADLAPKLQELERLKAIAASAADAAASDAQRLSAAQAALAAAQKEEVQAKADYAAQMRKFVADAGNSVGKLSDLRGEVVSFYEAQAQAVQGMLRSAGNLRSVVDSVRLGQLTTAQTAAELGNRYALDYALALSTTGSTRADYVDAMAGNLQGLSEAMKAEAATSADWKVQTAKLLAQATNAAGLLEGDANTDDYKDVSLGLLDSIDKSLESLNGMTKTAEQVIADAVNNGSASNLAGLRAIVAALQGQTVPAFASGGVHLGGLRIVGENGPELEATGPSRIWNQQQLAGALGGGGNSARTEQLLQQLIEEQRVQASRQVDLQLQLNKRIQRWDAMGMPETREVSA